MFYINRLAERKFRRMSLFSPQENQDTPTRNALSYLQNTLEGYTTHTKHPFLKVLTTKFFTLQKAFGQPPSECLQTTSTTKNFKSQHQQSLDNENR